MKKRRANKSPHYKIEEHIVAGISHYDLYEKVRFFWIFYCWAILDSTFDVDRKLNEWHDKVEQDINDCTPSYRRKNNA